MRIFRRNNIFDKVQNDYQIPMDTITEKYEMDIEKIKQNVLSEIAGKPKKTYRKNYIFIMIAAALLVISIAGVIAANGSKPVPIELVWLESDEYSKFMDENSKIPRVLNVPMPSDEEKLVIDTVQDEYVDLYQNTLKKYSAALGKEQAQLNAAEEVIKSLFENAAAILADYHYGSLKKIDEIESTDDMVQIIKKCCEAMDNQSMTMEEKIRLKFFVKNTYRMFDYDSRDFMVYVEDKMEMTFIPVIDIWTGYSHEKDKYYITISETSDESSS